MALASVVSLETLNSGQNRSRARKKPTFLRQGILILLPVALLAIVSLASLRHDEQTAEREAREKAQESARSLARAIRNGLNQEIQDYVGLQNEWIHELRIACQPSIVHSNRAAGVQFPMRRSVENSAQTTSSQFPTVVMPECYLLADGRLVEPTDFCALPAPPKWFEELTPHQRELWQAARVLENSGAPSADVKRAFESFLQTSPPQHAQLAAEYPVWQIDHKPVTPEDFLRHVPLIRSDSGIPLQALACYRALNAPTDEPLKRPVLDSLWQQVIDTPSFVSAGLLDKAEELTNRVDAVTRDQVRFMRQLFEANSRAREWLLELGKLPAVRNWHESQPQQFWVTNEFGGVLAILQPTTFENYRWVKESSSGYTVWLIPERGILDAILSRITTENSFLISEYEGAKIQLGRTIVPVFRRPPSKDGDRLLMATHDAPLATITETLGKSDQGLPFTVALYLVNKDKLLETQRRRAGVLGLLIGGAALAALIGFVTARRAFVQQLQLNELKSNFVSSVSHELRAPIASVRLLAESLERGKIAEAQKQNEYFRFIGQECRRLSSLIENVLDFSRIEQGRKKYEFEPTDVLALAEQTVKVMQPYAAERHVALELQFDSQLSTFNSQPICDGLAIQQALVNLIDNAIKHSPANTAVKVGVEPGEVGRVTPCAPGQFIQENGAHGVRRPTNESAKIRLWVEDQGPGIPASEHEKIFEQFYRRGSELRRETQGVGIGLTIVKHIVEAHGGRVIVRSAPGEGSRFTIELPAKNAKERE